MLLRFSKMHGLGSDLMVIDLISQYAYIQPQHMRAWSDRRCGVGFQRLALIEVPQHPDVDFSCRVFDNDGAEVDWLASDLCCVARLVADKRLISKAQMRVEVRHAVLDVQVHADGSVTVPLERPEILTDRMTLPLSFIEQRAHASWLLDSSFSMLTASGLHAVLRVADVTQVPMADLIEYLEKYACLPRGTIISVVHVRDRVNLSVLMWQLGVGFIDYFNPGLCAVTVSAMQQGWVNRQAQIEFANGKARARLEWLENATQVHFTGSASRIYEGQIRL
jgi:diaminopimelate epimerase